MYKQYNSVFNMKKVQVADIVFDNTLPFVLIAGPCQMESTQHGMEMASALKELTTKYFSSLNDEQIEKKTQ